MILPEEAGLESHVLLLYVVRTDQRDNLLRELRERGYGYKRIAGEYTRVTGEYISHTTVRVRLVDG